MIGDGVIIGLLLFVILLSLGVALLPLVRLVLYGSGGSRVEGTVLAYLASQRFGAFNPARGQGYKAVVRYRYEGTEYAAKAANHMMVKWYREGEKVPLLVRPRRPDRPLVRAVSRDVVPALFNLLVTGVFVWLLVRVFPRVSVSSCVLGAALALAAFVLYVFFWRRKENRMPRA